MGSSATYTDHRRAVWSRLMKNMENQIRKNVSGNHRLTQAEAASCMVSEYGGEGSEGVKQAVGSVLLLSCSSVSLWRGPPPGRAVFLSVQFCGVASWGAG